MLWLAITSALVLGFLAGAIWAGANWQNAIYYAHDRGVLDKTITAIRKEEA